MKLSNLSIAKKISIAGYGVEGKAAELFCKKHCASVQLEIVDPVSSFVEDDGSVWIVSPGISRKFFKSIPVDRVTSGTEIFFDSLTETQRQSVIGISGTKGKSTTTKFTTEVLSAAGEKVVAGGNYGVPLLDIYDDFISGKYKYVIAELSSYQLENLKTSPGLALFLNLYPDHLDRHGSFSSYKEAKSNVWKHQQEGDILIIPEELDINTGKEVQKASSLDAKLFSENSVFRAQHWCQNFGCVSVLLEKLSISQKYIEIVAQKFEGLPHRMQNFSHAHNREWWDDAICTNPEAAVVCVQFFGKTLGAMILGGQDRGMDVIPLANILQEVAPQAQIFILRSESAERFLRDIPNAKLGKDFNDIVFQVLQSTSEGTNIVLCPAAPSYDSFKNFQGKGDAWQNSVASI